MLSPRGSLTRLIPIRATLSLLAGMIDFFDDFPGSRLSRWHVVILNELAELAVRQTCVGEGRERGMSEDLSTYVVKTRGCLAIKHRAEEEVDAIEWADRGNEAIQEPHMLTGPERRITLYEKKKQWR